MKSDAERQPDPTAEPELGEVPMVHWHPKWFVFVAMLMVCIVGFLSLVLLPMSVELRDCLADFALAAAGLSGSAFGIWGETRNPTGRTLLTRFTWAGYMVLTTLVFGFGVGLYQKIWIGPEQSGKLRRACASEAKQAQEASSQKMDECISRQKDAESRMQAQTATRASFEQAANKNQIVVNEKLEELRSAAATCPSLKGPLDELDKYVKNDLTLGTSSALRAELLPISQLLTSLGGSVGDLKTDAEQRAGELSVLRQACLSRPLLFSSSVLERQIWVGQWAAGGWRTEARFIREGGGKFSFNASTHFVSPARDGHAALDVAAMKWIGASFSVADGATLLEFDVDREVLDTAQSMDPTWVPNSYTSTMRFKVGLALFGSYGKNPDGTNAELVLYEREPVGG